MTIGHGTPLKLEGVPVPVYTPNRWGVVEGVPEPDGESLFIVSALVGQRLKRPDLVMPGTGPGEGAVRKDGQIVAVTRLVQTG